MSIIGAWVSLAGPNWPAENRREFIDQAFIDTTNMPRIALTEALKAVRYRKIGPWEWLPWIAQYVEQATGKLVTERMRLALLSDILAANTGTENNDE